jgi:hypothetical protein
MAPAMPRVSCPEAPIEWWPALVEVSSFQKSGKGLAQTRVKNQKR